MRPKTEKQAITRIFLWLFSGIISLDLFYEGKVEKGIGTLLLAILCLFLMAMSIVSFSSWNGMGAGIFFLIFGLLVLTVWTIQAIKRLFQYLRMFEKTED